MKTKKFEKKVMLKKTTIANLNDQEMLVARGGCPSTPDCTKLHLAPAVINQVNALGSW